MKRGYLVAAVVFGLDQAVKYWVTTVLGLKAGRIVAVVPGFDLAWVGNPGVSMSLLRADTELQKWLLVAATLAIAAGVAWWIARESNRLDGFALGLVLGGALGNIIDRVRYGYVVDFIDLHWHSHHFYVFNVADAAISIGVALLLLRSLLAPAAKSV